MARSCVFVQNDMNEVHFICNIWKVSSNAILFSTQSIDKMLGMNFKFILRIIINDFLCRSREFKYFSECSSIIIDIEKMHHLTEVNATIQIVVLDESTIFIWL